MSIAPASSGCDKCAHLPRQLRRGRTWPNLVAAGPQRGLCSQPPEHEKTETDVIESEPLASLKGKLSLRDRQLAQGKGSLEATVELETTLCPVGTSLGLLLGHFGQNEHVHV